MPTYGLPDVESQYYTDQYGNNAGLQQSAADAGGAQGKGFLRNMTGSQKAGAGQFLTGAAQLTMGLINGRKVKNAAKDAVEALGTYAPSQEISGVYEGAKMRSTTGLSGAAKQIGLQGIQRATASAKSAAQTGKASLASIGAVQARETQGTLGLAKEEAAANRQNQASLVQAAGLQGREKEKSFKSQQEKQQLKASIALQELASKRAMVAQGIGGMASGLGNIATGGSGDMSKFLAMMG